MAKLACLGNDAHGRKVVRDNDGRRPFGKHKKPPRNCGRFRSRSPLFDPVRADPQPRGDMEEGLFSHRLETLSDLTPCAYIRKVWAPPPAGVLRTGREQDRARP